MAIVKASCPLCGDVEMTLADVRLIVCSSTGEHTYSFGCPLCRLQHAKPAPPRVVDALRGAGVSEITWSWPAELDEVKSGPPVSPDDLLEFHFLLESEGWMDLVLAGSPSPQAESLSPL